ncbi:MAG TPA: histidine phosphatase family protein [Mycobacteriales bacterium]
MVRRLVMFVRHGDYRAEPEELSDLGREQARLTAGRLAAGPAIDRIAHSTMPRALQTAELLATELGITDLRPDGALAECVPGVPAQHLLTTQQQAWFVEHADDGAGARRMTEAALRYLVPAAADTVELVVSHANVIRWLLATAAGAGPDAWFQQAYYHCALSAVVLRPERQPAVLAVNDAGHLPADLRGLDHGDDLRW